jgi:hypothetical protein
MSRYGTLRFIDSDPALVSFAVSSDDRGTLTPFRPASYEVLARLLNADAPVLLEEENGTRWRVQVSRIPSPGASSLQTKMRISKLLPSEAS